MPSGMKYKFRNCQCLFLTKKKRSCKNKYHI